MAVASELLNINPFYLLTVICSISITGASAAIMLYSARRKADVDLAKSEAQNRRLSELIEKLREDINHTRNGPLDLAGSGIDLVPQGASLLETEPESLDDSNQILLRPIPDDLIDACAQRNVLMLLGTSSLVRDHAPNRSEFLQEAIKLANLSEDDIQPGRLSRQEDPALGLLRLIRRDELDTVVDLLEEAVGRERLIEIAQFIYSHAQPSAELKRLYRGIHFEGIISVAFDNVATQLANENADEILTARSGINFETLLTAGEKIALQLAGDLGRPGTVCMTIAQLKAALYEAPDLRSVLQSVFSTKTILFVGMSVDQIEELWDAVGIYGISQQPHYALTQSDQDFGLIAKRSMSRYNIELIEISDRGEFSAFVNGLIGRTHERERRRRGSQDPKVALVKHLTLRNIGPFEQASVNFSSSWTVILGNNGSGKSTILKAIVLALCGTDREAQRYARTLLRRGQKVGTIELTLESSPQSSIYRLQIALEGDRVNLTSSVSPLQAGTMRAFGYAAVRGTNDPFTLEPITVADDPLPRISDVLPLLQGGTDSRVLDLRAWIRQNYAIYQDASLPDLDRDQAQAKLDLFFQIVDELAPGFQIRFSRCDQKTGEILLATSDGEIPLDYVSQGMSSMIGWLGTLIQRLYSINGDSSDPRTSNALVLIDEIDSHLHPEWQQRLVPTLRRTFPHIQMIATTHSAIMVGSLEEHEVVKVSRSERGLSVEHLSRSYKGFRFDQILTDRPFELESARDLGWESLREEYGKLLGKSKRTDEEEARYLELDKLMDNAPPPYEARADRDKYEAAVIRFDDNIIGSNKLTDTD